MKLPIFIEAIKSQFDAQDYKFFLPKDLGHGEFRHYNLNIFAIRSHVEGTTEEKEKVTNRFDDFLFCVYTDERGKWRFHQWEFTTQAGLHYMLNPLNPKGTAIIVPNQYIGVFGIGKHQGKYECLRQMGTFDVYRDNTLDKWYNYDPETIEKAVDTGINLHKAGENSKFINNWSAACQVTKRDSDFEDELMRAVYLAADIWGGKYTARFSYTLFTENQFQV